MELHESSKPIQFINKLHTINSVFLHAEQYGLPTRTNLLLDNTYIFQKFFQVRSIMLYLREEGFIFMLIHIVTGQQGLTSLFSVITMC